jgi:hypothetical protein
MTRFAFVTWDGGGNVTVALPNGDLTGYPHPVVVVKGWRGAGRRGCISRERVNKLLHEPAWGQHLQYLGHRAHKKERAPVFGRRPMAGGMLCP